MYMQYLLCRQIYDLKKANMAFAGKNFKDICIKCCNCIIFTLDRGFDINGGMCIR